MTPATPAVPRLTYLRIKNYRALRDVEFRDLTPLTVLIGPNGSGKSTVLDALDFLAEAVRGNLVAAWKEKGGFEEIKTQDSQHWTVDFEVEIELANSQPRLLYKLSIDEAEGLAFVSDESLTELSVPEKRLFYLDSAEGNILRNEGYEKDFRLNVYSHDIAFGHSTNLSSTPLVARIGFFPEQMGDKWPSALAIVKFFKDFRKFLFTDKHLKGFSDEGIEKRLLPDGSNLPNVLAYYQVKHQKVLDIIIKCLQRRIPQLAEIITERTSDGRLLLRFRDTPFKMPFLAERASGGTVKLAALFALLYEPDAAGLIGMDEPENGLHPQLLYRFTEELMRASEKRQLFISTHSPLLLDALEPREVWVMYRGEDGYAQVKRTSEMPNVPELVEYGSMLGYLWTSNSFTVGEPEAPYDPVRDAR